MIKKMFEPFLSTLPKAVDHSLKDLYGFVFLKTKTEAQR